MGRTDSFTILNGVENSCQFLSHPVIFRSVMFFAVGITALVSRERRAQCLWYKWEVCREQS